MRWIKTTELEDIKTAVEIIAILSAGIWICVIFFYEERYKPFAADAVVDINLKLEQKQMIGDLIPIKATITIHNTHDNKVILFWPSYYIIEGLDSIIPNPAFFHPEPNNASLNNVNQDSYVHYLHTAKSHYLGYGSLLKTKKFPPNIEREANFILYVHKNRFDNIRFTTHCYIFNDGDGYPKDDFYKWAPIQDQKGDQIIDDNGNYVLEPHFYDYGSLKKNFNVRYVTECVELPLVQ